MQSDIEEELKCDNCENNTRCINAWYSTDPVCPTDEAEGAELVNQKDAFTGCGDIPYVECQDKEHLDLGLFKPPKTPEPVKSLKDKTL